MLYNFHGAPHVAYLGWSEKLKMAGSVWTRRAPTSKPIV